MEYLLDTPNMLKVLGGALLVIGLLGGGFEFMAAKLPALTTLNRMIVVISGVLLLTTGIAWNLDQPSDTDNTDQSSYNQDNN
jgi:hypothetical protein